MTTSAFQRQSSMFQQYGSRDCNDDPINKLQKENIDGRVDAPPQARTVQANYETDKLSRKKNPAHNKEQQQSDDDEEEDSS